MLQGNGVASYHRAAHAKLMGNSDSLPRGFKSRILTCQTILSLIGDAKDATVYTAPSQALPYCKGTTERKIK